MHTQDHAVATVDALVAAARDVTAARIVVAGDLVKVPTVRLSPGQPLRGADDRVSITFADGIGFQNCSFSTSVRLRAASGTPDRGQARKSVTSPS